MRFISFIVFCLAIASPTIAQQPQVEYQKVLLPIVIQDEVGGAHGSRWAMRFSLLNRAGVPVSIQGYDPSPVIIPIPTPDTPTSVTFYPKITLFPKEVQGSFLRLDRRYADQVDFQLRVQDLSRRSATWGTEIPVVRERDFRVSALNLLDIPLLTGFRQALRIYDLDANQGAAVRIRIFRIQESRQTPFEVPADPLLVETTATFRVEMNSGGQTWHPGYVELLDLSQFPELEGSERVRIEIQPLTPNLRFWAFVSVTNNETQHVTTITPQ